MKFFSDPQGAIDEFVWSDGLEKSVPYGRVLAVLLRYLYAILRDFFSNQLTFRAMSLVYTTLLSIVPLVAVSFAMAKGLGMIDALQELFLNSFTQLGPDGAMIAENVLGMANRINGRAIGAVGVVFFLWTALSMVQKVEASFNYVWQVAHPRSLGRRVSEYLVVLLIGPVIMGTAFSIIASLSSNGVVTYLQQFPGFAELFLLLGKTVPFVMITSVFTFMYVFVPNTNVRLASALVGGMAAGVMWATMSFLFTTFIATSFRTFAVYASFGVGIVALLWLYLNWLILLLGSQLAFYHQNPAFLRIGRELPVLASSTRERLALSIMARVGQAFRRADSVISLKDIGASIAVTTAVLAPIAETLVQAGLLARTDTDHLVPGREMSRIPLREVLDAVRLQPASVEGPVLGPAVDELARSLECAIRGVVAGRTLADLVDDMGDVSEAAA